MPEDLWSTAVGSMSQGGPEKRYVFTDVIADTLKLEAQIIEVLALFVHRYASWIE